ncbi:phosphatase YidA [Klebsiella pneumoniae]|uniref:Phosphatase YidA n=1 Tax=Klebsiella pneumoniae TaxID=573 RepID=A0A378FSB5_KLEPN|nr:phosphatase YidA [Klebsiella pneumoniae]
MAIKLIAIDMDGTLLLPDHTISPAVKAAIAAARERGVNVVLTIGRPYAGVHSYLKELHMEQPGDYCITYNGALVQKAGDGSTVAQTALSYDDYRFLSSSPARSAPTSMRWIAIRCIPRTAISATTPSTNPMWQPFRWCSAKRRKWILRSSC